MFFKNVCVYVLRVYVWETAYVYHMHTDIYMLMSLKQRSTLAQKIPWVEEHGRLQSMGSLRVRHDWATSLSLFAFIHWRRKWQPTPVFLPGESQGQWSLLGAVYGGRTESDMTEATQQQHTGICTGIFCFAKVHITFNKHIGAIMKRETGFCLQS